MNAVAPLYQHYDLAEVLFYLKDGDYSFFDFIRDFSDNDAVVDMKENGTLYICNVSDSIIPDETVRRVIDVLEHWDEYLKQAYDWLRFWDFTNGELKPSKYKEWLKEWSHDEFEKIYEVSFVFFGLEDWPCSDYKEYCTGSEPKEGADIFSIEFTAGQYPLGFNLKFACEDRRLYKIIVHIL